MRLKILCYSILSIINAKALLVNAQEESYVSEICIKKGNYIFDGFYGFPYLAGSAIKTVYEQNKDNVKNQNLNYKYNSINNLNHLGIKFEYLLTHEIGIGLEYTYAALTLNYSQEKSILASNNTNNIEKRDYKASISKQRILAKINYHFTTTEKFDGYSTIGLGYKTSHLKSNNLEDFVFVSAYNYGISNLFPIAIRTGIGFRYFFNKNIGINAEVGIGGPLFQAGLSAKFYNKKHIKK